MIKLIILINLFVAYLNSQEHEEEELLRFKESVFTIWRNDTLNSLNSYFNDSLKFQMKSYTFYPSDSLKKIDSNYIFEFEKAEITYSVYDNTFLDLRYYYTKQIDKDSIENEKGKIGVVLSMIQEVDVLPNNFIISFSEYVLYYPSPTINLKYDFVTEYKDIKISSYSKVNEYIEYGYIRGRIDSKKIFKSVNAPLRIELKDD